MVGCHGVQYAESASEGDKHWWIKRDWLEKKKTREANVTRNGFRMVRTLHESKNK